MQTLQTIKKISAENLPPILVLSGDDIGQFEWMKEQLLKKVGYDSSDLNYSYFDMKETAYAEVELDLVSLPFFADEKIVILDHFVDVTTAKKRYLTDDELQSFEGYLSAPLETTRLIVIAEGKLDSKRRIVKLLKRDAQLLEATELKEQELRAHFTEEIKSLGLAIDSQAFDQLLIKSGFDFSEIQKNLEFLKTYKGASSITITDIEEAMKVLLRNGLTKEQLTVLHCNTEYPTPMRDVHLHAMKTIADQLEVKVGYSDHTLGIEIPIAAVALGACVIEKHFTLDREMDGPDHKASLEPKELAQMVSAIRNVEKALGGTEKKISASEEKNRCLVRKSIVAACDIKKGDVFTEENITVKRPGDGISPMRWEHVLGKEAAQDFATNDLIIL